jgi:hypoxanthine phosphoribosyltransferase
MAKPFCFVMMPSGNHNEYAYGSKEADYIYEQIIVPAVEEAYGEQVDILREIDSRQPGAVTAAIIANIARSDIAIVDITGSNPNVFLELGVRFSLRKNGTILLRQEEGPIPFDIGHLRCFNYSALFSGGERAKRDIAQAIKMIRAADPTVSDSIVFDAIPQLLVRMSHVNSPERAQSTMPWEVFWGRLINITDKFRSVHTDSRYVPTIVVGISNGGLMFADLLCRDLFPGTPIISLWADRGYKRTPRGTYFDNAINETMVKAIISTASGDGSPSVLLVDDIVASGTTHTQAIDYLEQKIPGLDLRFLPMFSRNERYFEIIKEHVIWKHEAFAMSDEQIRELHWIDWVHLPYRKDIRSS